MVRVGLSNFYLALNRMDLLHFLWNRSLNPQKMKGIPRIPLRFRERKAGLIQFRTIHFYDGS
ncbi:hypothetical protein B1R32_12529 [Abditibacterium utsteinense]|uniref:Uncharacterized protein n=1 Tax=Abditibacterium utsteinense TaxID=1960156 RepID=A0A2S8SPF9_9BACT|nr:hypothetical protein B1R32_12529 [Abditibacterium utsteinense]